MTERWKESLALSRMKRAFEYVELRRNPETHGDSAGEREAIRRMQKAFEAQDMRGLRRATRRYIKEAVEVTEAKEVTETPRGEI